MANIRFENHMKSLLGMSLAELQDLVAQHNMPKFTAKQLVDWLYRKRVVSKLRANGYSVACCSNSIRMTIEMMMSYAKLDKYLNFIVSNQDVKNAKPDPEIYLTAMKKLNLQPTECLIVEDNENGIKAAMASGGNLLAVKTVDDVTWDNVMGRIREIEQKGR